MAWERLLPLLGCLTACAPSSNAARNETDGDWAPVGEALGCQVLRLQNPKSEWLKWTACAQGGSCDEVELGAVVGESVYLALVSRRGTPRILIRSDYHLWVADAWGALVDGLAFGPCRATGMDARGDRVLSMFQPMGGTEQGLVLFELGSAGASVSVFPFDWQPAAWPVLGSERFLYTEPAELAQPQRLLSVGLADTSDVRQVGNTWILPPIDADDSFLYLDIPDTYQAVFRTDGVTPGAPYFGVLNDSVCWAQRSYDSLVWSTCQYTEGESDRVFRTSFDAPSESGSTLLLEQPHVGFGISAEGWYVSGAVAVRVGDGKVQSVESAPGNLIGVTATHAYWYSETWKPGGGDERYHLRRVRMP